MKPTAILGVFSALWLFGAVFPARGGEHPVEQGLAAADRLPGASSPSQWVEAQAALLSGTGGAEIDGESRGLASLKSLLLPGWGQLAEGKKTRAYLFLGVETALLGLMVSQLVKSDWLEDDYRLYACQHAGVSGDKGHQFYVDIGNWMERDSFNQQRLRYRQFGEMYTGPANDWRWDSDANRGHFKSLRIESDLASQRALLAVGGLLINHLLASIEAARGSRSGRALSVVETEAGAAVRMTITGLEF